MLYFLTCFSPLNSEQLGNLFRNRIRQIMTMSVMVTKANATTRTVTSGNGPDRGANNLSVELNFIVALNFKDAQI